MQQVKHPSAGARLGQSQLGWREVGSVGVPLLPPFLQSTLPCLGFWQAAQMCSKQHEEAEHVQRLNRLHMSS